MKADDAYKFALHRARVSVIMNAQGKCTDQSVDALLTEVVIQIRKHNETYGLPLLNMPEA